MALRTSSGPLAPTNAAYDADRAVRAYLRAQLSPRSRQNALDSLRRLSRLILGTQDADPFQIPWTAIRFEQATTIRSALYEMSRSGRIAPGTANLTLSHLRGLIRTMYALGMITANQHELTHTDALKGIPGKREPRGRALSLEEERALRKGARALEGYQGEMLDTAIVVAIGGGLRREEVALLTLESVARKRIVGKGNKERKLSMDAQMRAALETWAVTRADLPARHGGVFVAPTRPDRTLSPWSFWAMVRSAAHNAFGDQEPCQHGCACLDVVTGPHDFRRTFATRLLEHGVDIRKVQILMGHESIETTSRYDKREEEEVFEMRNKMRIIA